MAKGNQWQVWTYVDNPDRANIETPNGELIMENIPTIAARNIVAKRPKE